MTVKRIGPSTFTDQEGGYWWIDRFELVEPEGDLRAAHEAVQNAVYADADRRFMQRAVAIQETAKAWTSPGEAVQVPMWQDAMPAWSGDTVPVKPAYSYSVGDLVVRTRDRGKPMPTIQTVAKVGSCTLTLLDGSSGHIDGFALYEAVRPQAAPEAPPAAPVGDPEAPSLPLSTEGVKADSGKAPLSMIPVSAQLAEARVLAFGAKKYARDNWRKGMAWTRLADAAQRHLLAWLDGQDIDPETGESHLAHLRCCTGFLIEMQEKGFGTDDRYKGEAA